jgi:hypothetical protein
MASRGRGRGSGRGGGRGGRGGGRGGGDDEEELGRTPRELNMIKTPAPTWPAYDNLPVHPEDISPEELSLYSKAALMRDFFKTSPFYLKKDKQAKEVKRFSTEKLQSEFRNPTLMEYLHPLFRIFPNEVLEDDQAKRRREGNEEEPHSIFFFSAQPSCLLPSLLSPHPSPFSSFPWTSSLSLRTSSKEA